MMRAFLLALALTMPALAAEPTVISLWPEGPPGLHADAAPERIVNDRVVAVHYPSLTVYPAPVDTRNGTAVIYCPGGGYVRLAIGPNGGYETKFLNEAGVTVFILKYRMVEYGHPAPQQDVLRAIRIVRSRASEFGVKPDRIGLLGQSAGGHLAGCAAEFWDSPEGRTGAELDEVSARPDFVSLVYPVVTMAEPYVHKGSRDALLGKPAPADKVAALSLERHVRPDMPPMFLVATEADQSVPVENTLLFYGALRTGKVPAEMHVYAKGSHGNSLDPQYGPTAEWPQRLLDWMRFNGWLSR
jgi:acetyl esterase/lipase